MSLLLDYYIDKMIKWIDQINLLNVGWCRVVYFASMAIIYMVGCKCSIINKQFICQRIAINILSRNYVFYLAGCISNHRVDKFDRKSITLCLIYTFIAIDKYFVSFSDSDFLWIVHQPWMEIIYRSSINQFCNITQLVSSFAEFSAVYFILDEQFNPSNF